MQKWGLHRRIALKTLKVVGTQPTRMVGGFMLATAGLSMWVSNTATTIMMLPIAMSIISLVEKDDSQAGEEEKVRAMDTFALCLLLAIAYSASIGGIGTIIGTPPNLFLVSFVRETWGREIGFVEWMGIGLPLVAVFLPACWFLLTRVLFRIKGIKLASADAVTTRCRKSPG